MTKQANSPLSKAQLQRLAELKTVAGTVAQQCLDLMAELERVTDQRVPTTSSGIDLAALDEWTREASEYPALNARLLALILHLKQTVTKLTDAEVERDAYRDTLMDSREQERSLVAERDQLKRYIQEEMAAEGWSDRLTAKLDAYRDVLAWAYDAIWELSGLPNKPEDTSLDEWLTEQTGGEYHGFTKALDDAVKGYPTNEFNALKQEAERYRKALEQALLWAASVNPSIVHGALWIDHAMEALGFEPVDWDDTKAAQDAVRRAALSADKEQDA
jgi:hypothetical protein